MNRNKSLQSLAPIYILRAHKNEKKQKHKYDMSKM